MRIEPYIRGVHYYETDQMGVVHHSNYIRWFEEARVDMMEQIGYGYAAMEAEGIVSPVLAISCEYKGMVHFGETVQIAARITQFTGAKMTIVYQVENLDTEMICTVGESRHCFLNKERQPVSIKKVNPKVFELFRASME